MKHENTVDSRQESGERQKDREERKKDKDRIQEPVARMKEALGSAFKPQGYGRDKRYEPRYSTSLGLFGPYKPYKRD